MAGRNESLTPTSLNAASTVVESLALPVSPPPEHYAWLVTGDPGTCPRTPSA